MKKKFIALLLSILMIIAVPSAISSAYSTLPLDVGNFKDYGGGGDWGGGDFGGDFGGGGGWGGDDWGNDYGGDFGGNDFDETYRSSNSSLSFPAGIAAVIMLIIIVIIIFSILGSLSKKKASRKGTVKRGYNTYAMPEHLKPVDNTLSISKFISQNGDPDFSTEKFIAYSKNLFVTLQAAWTERDWEKIRTLEKEELFEQHNTQLQEYIRTGKINIIERINVNQSYLQHYTRDKEYEYLTVYMAVRMNDYIIDEATRKVVKGDPNVDYHMNYLLTFMRKRGIKTVLIDGVQSSACPHCGAPVETASAGRCEFCGSVVKTGEFNWVLSDMEALKPGSTINNNGIDIVN